MKHPAKYTNSFIPIFYKYLKDKNNILDPMAGTGKLVKIKDFGFSGKISCNDILDWGDAKYDGVDNWSFCDASSLPYPSLFFDALCTSPTYGNRMADHFNAKDESKRITYRHYYGKPLSHNNTGRMQWGAKYQEKHNLIYKECRRVLKDEGLFIINISDHIRSKEIIPVVDWHRSTIINSGFILEDDLRIETPRMGFGANRNSRVQHEHILIFRKGK